MTTDQTTSHTFRERVTPTLRELDELLRQLNAHVDSYENPIVKAAASANVAQFKSWLVDFTMHRFRLQSLLQLQLASYVIFGKMASDETAAPAVYRSVSYCRSPRYFRRPFIQQLAIQCDLAISNFLKARSVIGKPPLAQNYKPIRVDRVVIVPGHLWVAPDYTKVANSILEWWKPLRSDLRNQVNSGVDIAVVSKQNLLSTGSYDRQVDFGLYGTVAAGIYNRCPTNGEELTIVDWDSDEYRRCDSIWNRLWHERIGATRWDEFERRLASHGMEPS